MVAHYSLGPVQSRSLSEYLAALDSAGYLPVLISTTSGNTPLRFPHGAPDRLIVVRRENIGYDFGSWAHLLTQAPLLREANTVLLTNDSLLGPFEPIDDLLEAASRPGPDIAPLTMSRQGHIHAQSFFLAFHGGTLNERPWRDFFKAVRPQATKERIVHQYELGLTKHALREAYSISPLIPTAILDVNRRNPTLDGWRQLIEAGAPFLKRTILTEPGLNLMAEDAKDFVFQRFGVNLNDW